MVEPGESWGGKRSLAMARIAEGAVVGLRVGLGKDCCVAAGASVMHGILVQIAHNVGSATTLLLRKSHRGARPALVMLSSWRPHGRHAGAALQ